jgi:hypothetical protein
MTVTDDVNQVPEQSAELVSIIERGSYVLRQNPDASLAELAAAITDEVPTFWAMPGQVVPFPEVPTPVTLTGEIQQALNDLPEVFGKVNVEARRTMTEEEILHVYREHEALKALEDALKSRRDNLKTYVRHHMDVAAEEQGIASPADTYENGVKVAEASPRDPHGHYVLGQKGKPERLNIPGTNQAFSREASAYKAQVDGQRLTELYEAGQISREDYLAFTREVRVFDEDKARKALAKDRRLLGVLARITQRGGMKSALYVRKAR